MFAGRGVVMVRCLALGGRKIGVRLGTTDWGTLVSTAAGYHRPVVPLSPSPVILDLGCNVGYTLIDFATRHPGARVIGVEMDAENYACAVSNTEGVDGVQVVNRAVAASDGTVQYSRAARADAYAIADQPAAGLETVSVRATTVGTLLSELGLARVDYLKMDIEGEEHRIFGGQEADLAWLHRVQQMNIEVHGAETGDSRSAIRAVLVAHGFTVEDSRLHWSSLVAVRKDGGFPPLPAPQGLPPNH